MTNNISSDDFDKLLDDFIASQLQETEDVLAEITDSSNKPEKQEKSDNLKDLSFEDIKPSRANTNIFDNEISCLASEERRLFQAYQNFISAITSCANRANLEAPKFTFTPKLLIPRFRPSRTSELNADVVNGWLLLIKAQPTRLSSLPQNPSDEQILNFAEKTTDTELQNALISYVETLLEIDACEIAYNLRKVKYQKRQIEKKIYEDQLARKEKTRKYIEAIRAKNFPIDAEKLVNNFFKTARSDPDSAKKILENNPSTFAPIQIDKIPSKCFGLIKPEPEDGYKINKKLGKFLKTLKA